jgi:hypothetical protein
MTGHYPRIRLYEGDRLMRREVVRLVLHLPFEHHDLADGVNRALEVYLRAVGTGLEVLSDHDLGYEPYPLDEDGWERVRATLSPPRGRRFLDDLENPEDLHRYLKNQFERQVQLWGEQSGVSGYGFFYWSRLPWRRRSVEEEVSLVSFSWPTEYLEENGPGRMRELALELAALLPFSSGHAGLAFSSISTFDVSLEGIREEAARHPGVDVTHGQLSLGARVDGVHWLDFLGPPVLGELGGVVGLRGRLHAAETTVQELDGERAVVTLGKWPEAGDLARGRSLPAYRELARVLEPWLYACPANGEFDGATPEETRRWWRRFLD